MSSKMKIFYTQIAIDHIPLEISINIMHIDLELSYLPIDF